MGHKHHKHKCCGYENTNAMDLAADATIYLTTVAVTTVVVDAMVLTIYLAVVAVTAVVVVSIIL